MFLEVLIGLLVLGIILSAATRSVPRLYARYRLQRAIWALHAQMNYGRYKAVFTGTKYRISVISEGYTLEKYDPELHAWKTEEKQEWSGVRFSANNAPVFHPQGTVSNLATILVSNSSGSYRITISISGRIKTVEQMMQ